MNRPKIPLEFAAEIGAGICTCDHPILSRQKLRPLTGHKRGCIVHTWAKCDARDDKIMRRDNVWDLFWSNAHKKP